MIPLDPRACQKGANSPDKPNHRIESTDLTDELVFEKECVNDCYYGFKFEFGKSHGFIESFICFISVGELQSDTCCCCFAS